MRPIPPLLREHLASLPRMKKCTVAFMGNCDSKIDWDHVWIYAGTQINEAWAIVGVCRYHHSIKEGNSAVRHAIQKASLKLAAPNHLLKYPRKDWAQIERSLEAVDNFNCN